jgi:hypothetical protein
MSVTPSPIGGFAAQFFDNNGVILSGGKIFTYASGTTTPQASYTSASGVTPHSNPIILDSAGRVPGGEIWLTDGLVYKFVIETATGILLGTYDNITGVNSNFVNYTIQEEVITATAGQTVFNLTTINYTPGTNSLTVYIDGVNQYVGDSYLETDSDTVTFTSGVHVGGEVKFTTAVQTTSGAVNASIVVYDPPFTGGVATNVEDKLAQYMSVKDFGAVGDGVADDTAAIQAAIDAAMVGTACNTYFPSGTYKVTSTLTIPNVVNGKAVIYGSGAQINSTHNGVLFDNQSLWVSFRDLTLVGPGKTQANSLGIQGTAYDWYLENVSISDFQVGYRANGGNQLLLKCFFGGNGKCVWPAVFANIISIDSCYFSTSDYGLYVPNNFGPGPVMYVAQVCIYNTAMEVCGTSVYSVGINRLSVENSWFEQETTGSLVLIDTPLLSVNSNYVNFQPSISFTGGFPAAGKNDVSIDPYIGVTTSALNITRLNGTAFTTEASFKGTGNGQFSLTNSAGTGTIAYDLKGNATTAMTTYRKDSASAVNLLRLSNETFPNSGRSALEFYGFLAGNSFSSRILGGNNDIVVDAPNFFPLTDNATTCGRASERWSVVYAATGTINTSDEREKQDIADLSEAEKRVAVALKGLVKKFRFKDAVELKGDDARIHVGVIAQDVVAAFDAEGLDASRYALLCYDQWEDENGVQHDRYGVRYEELLSFIIGAL